MKAEVLCVFADLGVFARNPASPVRFIMEYASLTPGRDLDALVAERVFGVKYQLIHGDYCVGDPEDSIAYLVCPEYSTNIAAAFQVEELIEERDCLSVMLMHWWKRSFPILLSDS